MISLPELTEILTEADEEKHQLLEELKQANDEKQRLTESLSEANDQNHQLSEELKQANDEKQRLTESLSEANDQNQQLILQLTEAKTLLGALRADNEEQTKLRERSAELIQRNLYLLIEKTKKFLLRRKSLKKHCKMSLRVKKSWHKDLKLSMNGGCWHKRVKRNWKKRWRDG